MLEFISNHILIFIIGGAVIILTVIGYIVDKYIIHKPVVEAKIDNQEEINVKQNIEANTLEVAKENVEAKEVEENEPNNFEKEQDELKSNSSKDNKEESPWEV